MILAKTVVGKKQKYLGGITSTTINRQWIKMLYCWRSNWKGGWYFTRQS